MESENKTKKGDNPKGQGPSKPKKEKTKEEKELQRAKQAEKKRLKKEQARLEAEAKAKGEIPQKIEEAKVKEEEKSKENKKKEKKKENKSENKHEELKDEKKKRIKFFGLTTYEERNEELKLYCEQKNSKEDNSILSTYQIIENLSHKVEYSRVSEELIKSLRNIFLCGSSKQTRNCKNLLNAFNKLVEFLVNDDDDKTDDRICKELCFLIKKIKNLLSPISEKCSGIFNTCKYLQLLSDDILSELSEKLQNYKLVKMTLREIIKSKIEYFIERRVKKLVSENIKNNLIQDGDTILIFGKSKIFRQILKNGKEDKIKFNIIFVDSAKRNQMSSEVRFFANLGVNVNYTYLKGVSNIMSKVTKIFIKGDALLVNGDLIGKKGVSTLALIAKSFNRPVFVFCPFFKFMNKIILSNEPKILKQIGTDYKEITFEYDITPSELINTIICENGYIHSSSIPVYIRELEEQDTNFINEKNYELERQ